ncbi:MAG TPA: hypothetical protein PLN43_10580 [Anaerolineales bacterium]|nr:hypothetical protein [Anaerolineales bacterium]
MKNKLQIIISVILLMAVTLACGGTAATPAAQDPNIVINTAIAGTQQANALAQATVNANVLTAMPATPTPGPSVDYVALTEEELAALIDEAVAEAVAATEATTSSVYTTTSDDTVTTEEVTYVYDYYYYADYYVEYAEDLMAQYCELYADLAYQAIAEMQAIEAELNQLNETLVSIDQSLQEISTTLEQGLALAEESIAQLENAAQEAQVKAEAVKGQAQDMIEVIKADQQGRVDEISSIQPHDVPTDQLAVFQSAFDFIDAANLAMGDNKLSHDELMNLAQLGKNAQAGFMELGKNGGGPGMPGGGTLDFTQLSGRFGDITTQLARGEMPHARKGLGEFELSLGGRPGGGGPGLPGGGGPGGPGAPGGGGPGGPRP